MSGLQDWLLDKVGGNNYLYIKRLSANDTGATGGHQVGIYIPSGIVAELFPSIDHTSEKILRFYCAQLIPLMNV